MFEIAATWLEFGDEKLKETLRVNIELAVHRVDQLIKFSTEFGNEIHGGTGRMDAIKTTRDNHDSRSTNRDQMPSENNCRVTRLC